MARTFLTICSAAVLGSLMACANSNGAAATGTLSRETISVDGHERSYLLYTPAAIRSDSGLKPLVLVFHGGGGTARGIAREIGRSMHSLAERDEFFVAYPDAVDKIWDFGAGEISDALEVRTNDRAFFAAIMDELTATKAIDGRRIFATGISRGGQASYFVACTFPKRIRAIAPVAMPMPKFMLDLCTDAQGIGVAIINGTEDPLVPYDGGQIRVGRRERGDVLSTDTTIDFWRSRNHCAVEPTSQTVIDPVSDRMQVHVTRWDDCELAPVLLYRIEGGGHTWPSGSQYLPRFLVGPVNRDIDAAEEIWSFFNRFH